jgi:parvulin-like peptidyl-prolyl isomerase
MHIPASKTFLALAAAATLAGCGQKNDGILARVGKEVLTEEAFRTEAIRRGVSSQEAKTALLEQMVRDLKLMQLALERGYDKDPEILRDYHAMLISRAKQDFGLGAESADSAIGEPEILAHYNAHPGEFAVPARVRAAMIFVAAGNRSKIEEAKAAIQAAGAGAEANFGALAVQYSEDQSTRYVGGDLGYQVEGLANFTDDEVAAKALFALRNPGTLSEIVTGPSGFYVFKLLERTAAGAQPLAAVRERIRSKLQAARRTEKERVFTSPLAVMPAETRPDALAKLVLPAPRLATQVSRETPPPLPGSEPSTTQSNAIP